MSVVVIVTCDVCKKEKLESADAPDATVAVVDVNAKIAKADWRFVGKPNGVKRIACPTCVAPIAAAGLEHK